MDDLPRVRVLGVPLVRVDAGGALRAIERSSETFPPALVMFANAHTLNLAWKDPSYRAILDGASLVLNDGIGIQLAARMRGVRFPENLNGSDLNPRLLDLAAQRRWSVFLLGAAPGVSDMAAERLVERVPGLRIAGTHHGYFDDAESDSVVRRIAQTQATVLLVAMGNPRQEVWLARHLVETGCRVGIGVGAFFDFTAGRQKRAPAWMNRLGVEWMYRLLHDPGRLWRRYVVGNPLFLIRAWRTRKVDRLAHG